jgi:hypothetical protein
MIRALCCDCGATFLRETDAEWKVRCLSCWAIRKARRGPSPASRQGDPLRDELRENWRGLVTFCHPDKHGGSPLATRTTQWLLALRERLEATEATR